MYSVVRLQPSKQAYDVPVEGDWVTIAVIAEIGPVKVTSGGLHPSDTHDVDSTQKASTANEGEKRPSRKYLNMKLIDFGSRSSLATNSKQEIRGDAILNMLLFQADSSSTEVTNGDPNFVRPVYKGGSGGAYEMCAPLREGTVLAILNPRILKPYQV